MFRPGYDRWKEITHKSTLPWATASRQTRKTVSTHKYSEVKGREGWSVHHWYKRHGSHQLLNDSPDIAPRPN